MIKWLSYVAFISSLFFLSYLLIHHGQYIPKKVSVEDFATSPKYTFGLQYDFNELLERVKNRTLTFSDQGRVTVKHDHYEAKIKVRDHNEGISKKYEIQMYYQVPGVMTRPVIVEASVKDQRPLDSQATFTDFFWEIR